MKINYYIQFLVNNWRPLLQVLAAVHDLLVDNRRKDIWADAEVSTHVDVVSKLVNLSLSFIHGLQIFYMPDEIKIVLYIHLFVRPSVVLNICENFCWYSYVSVWIFFNCFSGFWLNISWKEWTFGWMYIIFLKFCMTCVRFHVNACCFDF